MTVMIWAALAVVILLYVTLGVWAVAVIFPVRAGDSGSEPDACGPPLGAPHPPGEDDRRTVCRDGRSEVVSQR